MTVDPHPGRERDPRTLNDYIYGIANPVSRVDPSGQFSLGEVATGFATTFTLSLSAYSVYTGIGEVQQGNYTTGAIEIASGLLGVGVVPKIPKFYSAALAARTKYVQFLTEAIPTQVAQMKAAGKSLEAIAQTANMMRNSIKIEARALTSASGVLGKAASYGAELSNLRRYGNKIGPTVEELVAKKLLKNPNLTRQQALEEIIESASHSRQWIDYVFGLGGAL